MLVLWSPRSVSSRWVRAEAAQADESGTLVPVLIEPCAVPVKFKLTQTADLSGWNGDVGDPRWSAGVLHLWPVSLAARSSNMFTFLGVLLPTFGGALAGIRYFGDFERFAAISRVAAEQLHSIQESWQAVFGGKQVSVPV